MKATIGRRPHLPPVTTLAALALAAAWVLGIPASAHAQDESPVRDPAASSPVSPAHETTVELVRDTAPPAGDETFPRHLMVRSSAAGQVPLVGPLADLGNVGAGLRLAVGWYFLRRFAVLAEIGAAQIPQAAGDDLGHTLASAHLLVRGTVVLAEALTIFAEVGGGAVLSTQQAHENVDLGGAEPMAALAASAGLEVDLLGWVSGEGGARFDVLFAERTWGATSVVASPYVALTLHF